jgi:hypothetical protein
VPRLRGKWWRFSSRLWRQIRRTVFDGVSPETSYAWAIDIAPLASTSHPGLLCVNPRFGLHLNLVLCVPVQRYQPLLSFLEKLNRQIHRAAAMAALRKPTSPPSIRRRNSGAAVFIQDVSDSSGGPVNLVAGYFARNLRASLKIAAQRELPSPPPSVRVQWAFASSDIRKMAARLYEHPDHGHMGGRLEGDALPVGLQAETAGGSVDQWTAPSAADRGIDQSMKDVIRVEGARYPEEILRRSGL